MDFDTIARTTKKEWLEIEFPRHFWRIGAWARNSKPALVYNGMVMVFYSEIRHICGQNTVLAE